MRVTINQNPLVKFPTPNDNTLRVILDLSITRYTDAAKRLRIYWLGPNVELGNINIDDCPVGQSCHKTVEANVDVTSWPSRTYECPPKTIGTGTVTLNAGDVLHVTSGTVDVQGGWQVGPGWYRAKQRVQVTIPQDAQVEGYTNCGSIPTAYENVYFYALDANGNEIDKTYAMLMRVTVRASIKKRTADITARATLA